MFEKPSRSGTTYQTLLEHMDSLKSSWVYTIPRPFRSLATSVQSYSGACMYVDEGEPRQNNNTNKYPVQ
jgi:hypothetical protein